MAQQEQTQLVSLRIRVLSLASIFGLRIQRCHELQCRSQRQLKSGLLWLWCRLAATAPIQALAWELRYATGTALKKRKN